MVCATEVEHDDVGPVGHGVLEAGRGGGGRVDGVTVLAETAQRRRADRAVGLLAVVAIGAGIVGPGHQTLSAAEVGAQLAPSTPAAAERENPVSQVGAGG